MAHRWYQDLGSWVAAMGNMLTASCSHCYKLLFNVSRLEALVMTQRKIFVLSSGELCIILHSLHGSRSWLQRPVSCKDLWGHVQIRDFFVLPFVWEQFVSNFPWVRRSHRQYFSGQKGHKDVNFNEIAFPGGNLWINLLLFAKKSAKTDDFCHYWLIYSLTR